MPEMIIQLGVQRRFQHRFRQLPQQPICNAGVNPKSFTICSTVTPGSRLRATRTTSLQHQASEPGLDGTSTLDLIWISVLMIAFGIDWGGISSRYSADWLPDNRVRRQMPWGMVAPWAICR
jgi:hypothetical protein